MPEVIIRPLQVSDAQISFKWRNDPEVWKYTGNKPDRLITPEIEEEWIKRVLERDSEQRFAICIKDTGQYVGNVQLTHINGYNAEFHIFIGEKTFWGKNVGTTATLQILAYAFEVLKLQSVFLDVRKENFAAIRAYEKAGFRYISEVSDYLRMAIFAIDQEPAEISIFMMTYNHGPYLQQALDGIIAQRCKNRYEIVIGDDCSTDNTRNILLEYSINHPGIFKLLFHKEKIGSAKNEKSIFLNCTGNYIAFCGGSDYWTESNKLQKQITLLESNSHYDLVYTNYTVLNLQKNNHDNHPDRKEFGITFSDNHELNKIIVLTALIRKEIISAINNDIHQTSGSIHEAIWQLIKNGSKAVHVKQSTYTYRID